MIRFFLGLVPAWAWAAFLALCAGSAVTYHLAALQSVRREVRAEMALQAAQDLAAATNRLRRVADDAEVHRQAVAADAAAARRAAERLRAQLAAAAAAPAAAGSAPAAPAAGVLADVLGQCVERVRALAEHADRAAGAGAACERSYESLTPP